MSLDRFRLEARNALNTIEQIKDKIQLEGDNRKLAMFRRRKKIFTVLVTMSLVATILQTICVIINCVNLS